MADGYFWFDLAKNKFKSSTDELKNLWIVPNQVRVEILLKIKNNAKEVLPQAITSEGIKTLAASKYVTFGNHTDDYVICTNCTEPELTSEIKICADKLRSLVDEKYIDSFAYPNGNYDEKTITILKNNNIRSAFTTSPTLIQKDIDLYRLPRAGIPDKGILAENILHAFGIWQPIITRIKKLFITN